MDVPLRSPDYSCISSAGQFEIKYRLNRADTWSLMHRPQGLWRTDGKFTSYGKEKRRVWRKLHTTVDAAHAIVAAEVKLETVADNESTADAQPVAAQDETSQRRWRL